ncbi:MAG TPA: glycosyltransferase family 2 protein [Acidobacteriaceae bacterium]|nr:glycosyltransferase family 2 protein [Acidobacteriaceae bacterium]
MRERLTYVLITPARNEAQYIGLTLRSMVAQTHKPLRWVIVSDGSTDATDEIVREYTAKYSWIELLRMPERRERHFAGKVHAFETAYAHLSALDFDVVGNLDGDVSFEPDHFEYLVGKMAENPELGVAGAPFCEGNFRYDFRFSNIENVWGGCQLFRRTCFEDIGGYKPLKAGCIDHVAVVTARMKGWHTRTFTDRVCIHHRLMGTAGRTAMGARFRMGQKDFSVANHPLWEIARASYQMTKPPFVIGGVALAAGYLWSALWRKERAASPDLAAFIRREQLVRLRNLVNRYVGGPEPITVSDRTVSQ